MLGSLKDILAKTEAHATARKIEPDALLQARLFPDMFPLARQVLIACDFAKGVAAAPGIAWYSPNEQGGWMFTSYITRVSGTVMGRKVEGFSEYATCWSAPGVSWPATYIERGMVWLIVCNEYEDGTRDLCHIGYNRDDCQFAFMLTEKGPRMVTRDVKLQIELDEGRYPKTLHYEIGGEKWRWDGAPHGHIGHPQVGIERGREGVAKRAGDTRKVKIAYGWVNFFADSRIDHLVIKRP